MEFHYNIKKNTDLRISTNYFIDLTWLDLLVGVWLSVESIVIEGAHKVIPTRRQLLVAVPVTMLPLCLLNWHLLVYPQYLSELFVIHSFH